jgi:hypothetical protein
MMNILFLVAVSNLSALTVGESTGEWRLANRSMKVSISKSEARIVAIEINGKQILSAPVDIELPLQISGEQQIVRNISMEDDSPRSIILRGTRELQDAVLNLQYTLDTLKLLVEVDILGKIPRETELRVDYCLPLLRNLQYVFFPNGDQPTPTKNIGKKQLVYRTDLAIPFCTSYNNKSDYGVTIFSPLEISKPWLAFITDNRNLIISYQRLRLSNQESIKTAITIVPHGGDWRPGLDEMLSEYPDYFQPVSEHTLEGEGWYYLADAFDTANKIEGLSNTRVAWVELHGHFPFYGLYMPEKSEWGIIFDSPDYSLSDWSKGSGRKMNSYARMKNTIDIYHRFGIQVYLYFQCFEAWYQYAQKYFERSIARDKYGDPMQGWKYTQLMNPDPSGAWGKHIEQQITEILKIYPDIDGIFYDRMDYWHYDFAHDDGITIVDNKPAYTLGFAQQKINESIFQMMHANNKGIWGNGPASIDVCKNLDGVMAERHTSNLLRLQYLAIARPIIFLAYDREPKETEDKLKNALLCGAFPSITYGNDQCQQLDQEYRPLFDLIKNRKWVLHENPIEVPKEFLSNVFQVPGGNYVAVIIDPKKSHLNPAKPTYNIPVIMRIPDAEEIKSVRLLSADWPGTQRLNFEKRDNALYLTIPKHLTTSVVYLTHER